MLAKRERVGTSLFDRIIAGGRGVSTEHLMLRTIALGESRSAISVAAPKKAFSKATERGKLRRKGYHAVRALLPRLLPGHGSVLFMKKGVEKLEFSELLKEVEHLFSKAGILRRP